MSSNPSSAQRLFLDAPLSAGVDVTLDRNQANYLLNVLRMKAGDALLVFNGRDGEWRARIEAAGKRECVLALAQQTRAQEYGPDLEYLFAPLKHARLDYMVQKAVEMGVRRLRPVLTRRTQVSRVNLERMRANAIEAAEQCGILWIPEILEPEPLESAIAAWEAGRRLIVCDEAASHANPAEALRGITAGRLALLIGPEGGFAPEERELFTRQPFVTVVSLGPRILRADTAAVAALAVVQSCLGDWA